MGFAVCGWGFWGQFEVLGTRARFSTNAWSLTASGLPIPSLINASEIRQVVEPKESLRIRLCSGLDERVWYSQFAQLLWPENQSRIGPAVVWIKHPQVNQSRSRFPIRRPVGVVDGHYAVIHGSPPDAVAAVPSAEAVVGAIGQIEVHGVASRITFKVVEDQARAFQHGLDPGL